MDTEHNTLTPAEVWLLLCEGFNEAEIAAAAGVKLNVALSMIDEALGRTRGSTIRRIDKLGKRHPNRNLRELAA